ATSCLAPATSPLFFLADCPSKPPSRVGGASGVDVEIDVLDAALRLAVLAAGTPGPVDHFSAAHLGKRETFPLPTHRTLAAAALELPGQRLLGSPGVAENDRAKRTRIALVHADDRPFRRHRLGEQLVGWTRHENSIRRLNAKRR